MGCGESKCPTKFPEDPDRTHEDGYKEIQNMCETCRPNNNYSANSKYCPSDEWEQHSIGDCGWCIYDRSPNCSCSRTGTVGTRVGCRRKKGKEGYKGDPVKCCANLTPVKQVGQGKTCDPRFRGVTKTDCKEHMITYCSIKENFLKPVCKAWMQNNAKNNKENLNGTINDLAFKFCPGSSDPFCACYNAKMPANLGNSQQAIALFRCLDPKCQSQEALNTLNCPSVYVDCDINNVQVAANASEIERVTIANRCGNVYVGDDKVGEKLAEKVEELVDEKEEEGGHTVENPQAPNNKSRNLLLIIGLVMFLIALMLAIFFVTKKPKNTI